MKKIAFLTSDNYRSVLQKCPDFINEIELLQAVFAQYHTDIVQVNWRDTTVNWQAFDLLLPKMCWNYAEHALEFRIFVKKMIDNHIAMKNHGQNILWNMQKTYLLDLQKLGLPVGDFLLIPQGSQQSISEIARLLQEKFQSSTIFIAKPAIGAGAVDIVRFEIGNIANHRILFNKILATTDLLLQPFFSAIATEGEYSYFFFKDTFSHAILKKPAIGDYRAHQLYGAKNTNYMPTQDEIKKAFSFISATPLPCAYARVDVFRKNHCLYLIELELIEPYLYFERAPKESVYQFCQAILE